MQRHRQSRHRDFGLLRLVELDHLINVHTIDMIGPKDRDQVRPKVPNDIQIVIDRVRCPLVPLP